MKRVIRASVLSDWRFNYDPVHTIDIRSQLTDADVDALLDEYAGCIEYYDGLIHGDEVTISQIRRNWGLD